MYESPAHKNEEFGAVGVGVYHMMGGVYFTANFLIRTYKTLYCHIWRVVSEMGKSL